MVTVEKDGEYIGSNIKEAVNKEVHRVIDGYISIILNELRYKDGLSTTGVVDLLQKIKPHLLIDYR